MGSCPVYEVILLFLILLACPISFLFSRTLILGILITTSSPSWVTAWVGLELNLLSFIPIILTNKKNILSSEATLKYFLTQALGSAILLVGALLNFFSSFFPQVIILLALLLKVGAAPLHFWFPSVIQSTPWLQCIVLITLQKIAPLTLISQLSHRTKRLLIISSVLSAILGRIGGFNQTILRKLIAYSSINHIAWILAAIYIGTLIWWRYFIIYSVVTTSVVILFYIAQIIQTKQILSISTNLETTKIALFVSLFSLGGLPPLLGFIPKIIIISCLATNHLFVWVFILVIRRLVTLYFYTRITLIALTFNFLKVNKPSLQTNKILAIILLNIVPTTVPAILDFQY